MNRVLLDTTAYSLFMQGHAELTQVIRQVDEIYLNPIVLGELLAGFKKGKRERKNRRELDIFLESPRVRLIEVDDATAERYAVVLNSLWGAGSPIPTNDIWIAASAMQYGLRILTSDAHYRKVTQVMVEFFEPGS
jgi:predicted nucleic acid-binding protein